MRGHVVAALFCLFGRRSGLQLILIVWLTTILVAYHICILEQGGRPQWGCLGNVSATLQISPPIADESVTFTLVGLLVLSFAVLLWSGLRGYAQNVGRWLSRKKPSRPQISEIKQSAEDRSSAAMVRFLKIACAACGGHIQFPTNAFGEKIPCPHCQTTITLQKARNVKMPCPSCGGRIEFPDYAIGQTVPCPHCQTDMTLRELE